MYQYFKHLMHSHSNVTQHNINFLLFQCVFIYSILYGRCISQSFLSLSVLSHPVMMDCVIMGIFCKILRFITEKPKQNCHFSLKESDIFSIYTRLKLFWNENYSVYLQILWNAYTTLYPSIFTMATILNPNWRTLTAKQVYFRSRAG